MHCFTVSGTTFRCLAESRVMLLSSNRFERTQSWELSLFAPSMALMVIGAIIYTLGCRNELIDFDNLDNSPFPLEKAWAKLDKDE